MSPEIKTLKIESIFEDPVFSGSVSNQDASGIDELCVTGCDKGCDQGCDKGCDKGCDRGCDYGGPAPK